MPTPLTTGVDLGPWRARLGLSVTQAAAELRIQATSLRNLESGRKAASPTLLRLAELLELQHAAPAPVPAPTQRPSRRRKPKSEKPTRTYADPIAAAAAKVGLPDLSEQGIELLRIEVARQRAGGSSAEWELCPVDPDGYRVRWDGWLTTAGCPAPLPRMGRYVREILGPTEAD